MKNIKVELEIIEDMGVDQLEIFPSVLSQLGIQDISDVRMRQDEDTGNMFVLSRSKMEAEIERLEQLKGSE